MVAVLIYTAFSLEFQKANSVDHDQTSHLGTSELGLHCLHNTPKRVSRIQRIKGSIFSSSLDFLISMVYANSVIFTKGKHLLCLTVYFLGRHCRP